MSKKKMENAVFDEVLSQALLEASEREFETMETVYPEDILSERQMKVERRAYEMYERSRQKKRITQIRFKRVACFLITIVLISTLLFSVPKVRAGILQLVNRIFAGYTTIDADGGPSEVEFNDYLFKYIPEGFELESNNTSNNRRVVFANEDGKNYTIKRYSKENFTVHHDNDQSIIEEVSINGNLGYYSFSQNDDISLLNWSDENSHYVITGNIPKEEMIKIAQNMKYLAE